MRKAVWLSLVVIVSLLLSACGPAKPLAGALGGRGDVFVVALPRLVVDLDSAGTPTVFGLNAAQLAGFFGLDVQSFGMSPSAVKRMTDANVQHVEVRQQGDAAVLLVNGKPMPHIGWTDESLQQASDLAGLLGMTEDTGIYRRVLPLVRRLGLDLVLRFPRQPSAPEIPLADPNQPVQVNPTQDAPSAIAYFEIKYDDRGIPAIMGVSATDLQRLGINPKLKLALQPEAIRRLQEHNVQYLELRSKSEGLWVYVNGNPLPNVIWDDALLKNATELYTQINSDGRDTEIVKLLGPFVDRADVDILLHFPPAAGQQPIPVQRHE